MTLRALEIFLKVTETLNMQAAARALYISAPSVSECIAELERECGALLFERLNRRLYLTATGERMREYALRLTNVYDEMQRQLTGAQEPLRLGVTLTIASSVLLPVLRRFGQPKPRVTVCNTQEVERLLLSNQLDLGYVEGSVHHPKLKVTPMDTDALVLACRRDHPLAKRKTVRLAELEGQELLLRERGSGTRERLTQAMDKEHIQAQILWECGSVDALLKAVEEGVGLTVISRRLIPPTLTAIPMTGFESSRAFSLVMHCDKYETEAIRQFFHACREEAGERDGEDGGDGAGASPPRPRQGLCP